MLHVTPVLYRYLSLAQLGPGAAMKKKEKADFLKQVK
jgi:hypothetical protein